jgi:phosphotransferase system enzyme I (PtsI)
MAQKIIHGKSASGGIAIGKLAFFRNSRMLPVMKTVSDISREIERYNAALLSAEKQLEELSISAEKKLGAENAELFESHVLMLQDPDFAEAAQNLIEKDHICAEYAVYITAENLAAVFAEMDDEYMRGRAADIRDVAWRVIDGLRGTEKRLHFDEPIILAADDFSPSETASLDRMKILAMITAEGTDNSHTVIFARTMGIPAVIGLAALLNNTVYDGKQAVVDAEQGLVYLDPDPQTLQILNEKLRQQEITLRHLEQYRGKKSVTKSGRQTKIFANIASPADIDAVIHGDAEGIGLFRSEFLFLNREDFPDEETQYKAYAQVAEKMTGKQVIIRTLDIGADKQAAYFDLPHEENPALGMRAIRICLTRPDIFKVQIRALYRASVHGNISIMLPMITSLSEIQQVKYIAKRVCGELDNEKLPYNPQIPIGIMIETPASALISDQLAKHVDFFSIGTNDLTQYTLAIDRQNSSIERFQDAHHEAILQLIRITVKNAHINGISAGICGELASDPALLDFFLQIGVDELSVPPSKVLKTRSFIAELD